MNLIVAVDRNWAIGNKGQLLVSIPEDMKLFRSETMGKVVVMGRKTLESFPGGNPLKNRVNVVITKDPSYEKEGVMVCHSVEEALEVCKHYDEEDIYIIGGETIYRQFLPYVKDAHITKIDYAYEADTYFPNLDELPEWKETESSDERTYFDLEYYFKKYENSNPKSYR
ncbi:MAG: dihydrofolate reductase [Lachnospiraceae bacterium]|nr:dihydrofolate reductase [Lachnospiraceae bacterium]